jgi:lipid II:glycine glycyltransferase (peptidoglycan interpeptide bridge formation enzyme)
MKLQVIPFDNSADAKTKYDEFLTRKVNKPHASFLQTWEWGDMFALENTEFERLGFYDGDNLVGVTTASTMSLRLGGKFKYCGRGIALDYTNDELITSAHQSLREYYKGKGFAFVRVDPNIVEGDEVHCVQAIDKLGPKKSPFFTQVERAWCLDIKPTEDEQMEYMRSVGMGKTVGKFIRRAQKEGVVVRASSDPADLELFTKMMHELEDRKGAIGKASDEHYRTQFEAMAPSGKELVFFAELDGEILSTVLVAIFGKEISSLHGASSPKLPKISATRYMYLQMMMHCVEHYPEVERFNFWGVVSDKNRTPKHPRHGYSEFKRQFGGYVEVYMRSRDFVYSYLPWRLDWFLQKYLNWKSKND